MTLTPWPGTCLQFTAEIFKALLQASVVFDKFLVISSLRFKLRLHAGASLLNVFLQAICKRNLNYICEQS